MGYKPSSNQFETIVIIALVKTSLIQSSRRAFIVNEMTMLCVIGQLRARITTPHLATKQRF